jgi:hypothetical protein
MQIKYKLKYLPKRQLRKKFLGECDHETSHVVYPASNEKQPKGEGHNVKPKNKWRWHEFFHQENPGAQA